MKTLGEVLSLSTDFLQKKGVIKPRRQVEELLSHILHLPRIELYMQYDRPLIETELENLREAVKRSASGEPWQYIVGEVEFFGCRIRVNKNTLIPRQETEILVDMIVKELPSHPVEIWDICTGSGCIGIALKKKRPDCRVVLADISPEALTVARENVALNQVDVEILQGDLLVPFQGRKADIVVCNPPYVTEKEYAALDPSVKNFEPKLALVGGTPFYERLSCELPAYLHLGACAYFEIGTEPVLHLFSSWSQKEIRKDWSAHERFLRIVKNHT